MRGINAKRTGRSADTSKRIAKRAVLLAVLVASGSTAGGQQPPSGVIQSRFFNSNHSAPRIVRQGAKVAPAMAVGAVQTNPFVGPQQPQVTADTDLQLVTGNQTPAARQHAARQHAPGPPVADAAGFAGLENSPVGRVRQNPQFQASGELGFGDQPLIALGHGDDFAITRAEAFDRFDDETVNAFSNSGHPAARQLPVTARTQVTSRSPAPLAIPTGAAAPIRSASSTGSLPQPTGGYAAPIDVAVDRSTRVIPATDAREHPATIQETQPIYFTLSDDAAEAGDTFTSEFQTEDDDTAPAAEPPTEIEPKLEPRTEPQLDSEPDDESEPEPESEPALGSEPEAEPTASESAPPPPPLPLATPVKLAPAVNFAAEPLPQVGESAGDRRAGRADRQRIDSEPVEDSDADALIVSNRTRVPLTSQTATSQSVTQQLGSISDVALSHQPKAVAVVTPPINLRFADSDDAVVQSAIAPITFGTDSEPTTGEFTDAWPNESAMVNESAATGESALAGEDAEVSLVARAPAKVKSVPVMAPDREPTEVVSIASAADDPATPMSRREPIAGRIERSQPEERPRELAALPAAADVHAIVTSVTPRVEQIGTDEAPLIGAPVAVNPSQMSAHRVSLPSHTSGLNNGSGTRARTASSRQSIQRRDIEPEPKRIDVTLPDPSFSQSPADRAKTADDKRPPVVLQLKRAQVRSMTIGGRVRRFTIENKDVCQAFASSANQIKLIGTGIGQTRLSIWADVAEGEPTRMQTFQVRVSEGVDAIGDKVAAHTELLNDSIDQAFPTASVVVSLRGGQLHVTGHCDDEETAKQIVRMVRKSCLVPVQDNLKVR